MGPAWLRVSTRCICILRPSSPRSLSVACPPLSTVAAGCLYLALPKARDEQVLVCYLPFASNPLSATDWC